MAGSFGRPLSPFADAIAHAEGFYIVGSRSNRNRNPGDFILAPPATNYTSNSDGTYAVFDTVDDGWQCLEDELDFIRRGVSHFKDTFTFEQLAQGYSPDGWQNWAANVSKFLGAVPSEQIGKYL
jgi:hypothetical protein